ncbi:MAG: uroporphyrinogen decarboxylase family protein [Bacteroidota bacterium]
MAMSGRERLLRSFRREPVDRRAVSPFIHANFVRAFQGDPQADLIQGTIEVYRHFGFDLMHRNVNVRPDETALRSPAWTPRVTARREGNATYVTTTITTPERVLTQVVRQEDLSPYHRVKAQVEWFIKEEADFHQFVRYQPPVPALDLADLRRAAEAVGEEGITAPWVSGVFNTLADYRKLDDLLVDAVMAPEFYAGMARYFLERQKACLAQVVRAGVDALSYAGNIAGGSLVGPDFFRRYVLVYERELIQACQGAGVPVLYHNCGDARNMIEVYNELGMAAYESIAEPPYADNDLADAVARFSKDIALIGNLDQISFLRTASPDEVWREARRKLAIVGERRGFILGTSDFLEEGTPFENLFALAEAVKASGE